MRNNGHFLGGNHRVRTTKVESFSKMGVFLPVKLAKNQKVVFLQRFLSLRPVAVRTATKGFINFGFWFLKIPARFFAGIFLLFVPHKLICAHIG